MKYLHHTFLLTLLFTAFIGFVGCDAVGSPAATITGIDLAVEPEAGEFLEIQDVSGRAYVRVETFPATVDIPLYKPGRDYFMVLIGRNANGNLRAVSASNSFKTSDLTGGSYTTTGELEVVLSLQ